MGQLAAGAAVVKAAAESKAAAEVAETAVKAAQPWGAWLRERWTGKRPTPPAIEESTAEAAQQYLGKASKIQTGLESVFLKSFQEMGIDEIRDVRALKEKYSVGAGGAKMRVGRGTGSDGGNHSDLIIADHMEFNTPNPRATSPLLVALLAMAAGAGAAYLLNPPPPAAAPAAAAPAPGVPTINPPSVTVDDLKLKVKWWIDPETGKVQTKVIEQAP